MNGSHETKSEIRARLDEIRRLRDSGFIQLQSQSQIAAFEGRIAGLEADLEAAQEDLSSSIVRSHKALCEAKRMEEKAAYGHDPAVYYTLGVCGEAGEMANAIVKAMRNGDNRQAVLEAVCSELPDVIIYSYVLSYVLDIDLSKLVNDKVEIVVERALKGYYGGPLNPEVPGALK